MFWPFTRLFSYTPGAPVRANDLNELQDATIHARHGPIQVPIPLGLAILPDTWTYDDHGWIAPADGGGGLFLPLPFAAGTDIIAITVWWNLRGFPILSQGASDYLYLHATRRDPYADTTELERMSPAIRDQTTGDHTGQRVRYTWSLDADPIHVRPDLHYRIGISLGQAARRVDAVTATVSRR